MHRGAYTWNISAPNKVPRMKKPAPKREDHEPESTTELIAALCEITIETAEAPLSDQKIEAIERRLKTKDPRK